MDVKERQKLRNQVSAQQSRIKKKAEVSHLQNLIKTKDRKFKDFIDHFVTLLEKDDNQHFIEKINDLLLDHISVAEDSDDSDSVDENEKSKKPVFRKMQKGLSFGEETSIIEDLRNNLEMRFITSKKQLDKFKGNYNEGDMDS